MNSQKYKKEINESAIQRTKHVPSNNENIYSIHARNKHKTLWYESAWETMESSSVPTNKERVTYKSKIYPYHALHRTLMTTILPEITVNDENIDVRWCDNIVVSMIKTFRLLFNDTELQYGNSAYLFTEYNRLNCNTINANWTSHIPELSLSANIPFSYASHQSNAFPLSLCGQNDRLHHIFEFNLMIENLLVMRNKETQEIIDFDATKITVTNALDSVPVPELEGLYSTHINDKCDLDESSAPEYFVDNIYYYEHENEINLGKRVQIKFDGKNNCPVEEVCWGALNTTLTELNKTHVVLTSDYNSPIRTTKLESSSVVLVDNKSSFKTEYAYLNDYSDACKGISRWTNAVMTNEDGRKFVPGIDLSGGKITVNTRNEDLSCKFLVFVIMKHTRKFVFKTHPKSQEERLVKGATIEIIE